MCEMWLSFWINSGHNRPNVSTKTNIKNEESVCGVKRATGWRMVDVRRETLMPEKPIKCNKSGRSGSQGLGNAHLSFDPWRLLQVPPLNVNACAAESRTRRFRLHMKALQTFVIITDLQAVPEPEGAVGCQVGTLPSWISHFTTVH